MEQNREPRYKPIHTWLIYDKEAKNIHWVKDAAFNK